MSIKLMTKVWDTLEVAPGVPMSQGQTLVLLVLADCANDSGVCHPSVPTIARRARMSERQVQRVLRDLETAGIISIQKRDGASSVFALGGDIVSPVGVTSCHQGGDICDIPYLVQNRKNTYSNFFETLWRDYPNRDGKKAALRHFNTTVKSEADCRRIRTALDNYLADLRANDWKKPKNGSTWFNNWMDWEHRASAATSPSQHNEGASADYLRKAGLIT